MLASGALADEEGELPRRRIPILWRYVFREVSAPFLISLSVFTGLLFLTKSLKLFELVISRDVSLWEVVSLFLLVVPQFLEIALPMALLLGIVLAFGRLSADSELVVIRSVGVRLRTLVSPVLTFTSLCLIFGLVLGLYIRPWANFRLALSLFEMAQARASSGLIPGVFNDFGALTVYCENAEEKGERLSNVLISDRRDADHPRVFIARHGQMRSEQESRTVALRLFDGSMHEGRGLTYNVTYFDANNIVLSQDELAESDEVKEGKKSTEMPLGELIDAQHRIQSRIGDVARDREHANPKDLLQAARYDVELHRRFAVPVSCLAVAFIGMALGVQPSRGGKSWGIAVNIAVGILFITLYYFSLAFATALGEQLVAPAWVTMWIPNVLFAGLAAYLFWRIESEEWLAVSEALGDRLRSVGAKIRKLLAIREE